MSEMSDADVFGAQQPPTAPLPPAQAGDGTVIDAPSGAALNPAQTAYYRGLLASGKFDPKTLPPHQVREGEEPTSGEFVDLNGNLRQAGQPAPAAGAAKELSDADVFGATPQAPAAPADNRPVSQTLGFDTGVGQVAKNFVDMLHSGLPGLPANPLTINPLTIPLKLGLALHQGYVNDREKTERPGMTGKVMGEIAATAPVATDAAGPLMAGAMQGLLTSDAKDPLGRAVDTLAGGVGGKLGDLGLGTLRSVTAPVVRPAAQWAAEHGIGLTPGQTAGGIPQWIEGLISKGPIVGPMVRNAQNRTMEDFGRATYDRLLTPAGLPPIGKGVAPGNATNAAAHKAFSDAYGAILPPLTLQRDQAFEAGLPDLVKRSMALGEHGPAYAQLLKDGTDLFDASGQMGGRTFKDFDTQLGQEVRAASRDPALMSQKYANAVQELQAHFRDALERSNPNEAPRLSALNKGYAGLVTADKATVAQATNEGRFTPNDLIRAGRATDFSNRKSSTAAGEAMLQDWANQAKQNGVPDKFAAGGSLMGAIPEAIVTMGVGKESGLLHGIGGMAALDAILAGMYTKPAIKTINAAMTKRPAMARTVAQIMGELQPVAGYAGATAAPKALPYIPKMLPDLSEVIPAQTIR